jgi:Zn-dependent alcohol dehydrogenase
MSRRFLSPFSTSFVSLILAVALGLLAILPVHAEPVPLPTTTRKVILEKVQSGYRWKLIEAPVPSLGERQVLVHVRAVALNRGDLEMLEPNARRDYTGRVPTSDAAGDVVDVGKEVRGIHRGQRVTNL